MTREDPGAATGAPAPKVEEVAIAPRDPKRLAAVLPADSSAQFDELVTRLRRRLEGRTVWHVNSSARGGGVAEMLQSHLAYVRGAGIDTRWLVIPGSPDFFHLTKRLHHALHGSPGDGSALGDAERARYEEAMRSLIPEVQGRLGSRDVVVLHDPQTAGLIPAIARLGLPVVWRCHVGTDDVDAEVQRAWAFLEPYVRHASACIFTHETYIPECCDSGRSIVITPSIDPLSPKNQPLDADVIRSILVQVGILEGPAPEAPPVFHRADGSPRRVDRSVDLCRAGRAPGEDAPVITQVSRWDPLKDPVGLLHGFERMIELGAPPDAHLVLAGPSVHAVADDPEAVATYDRVEREWRALPSSVRSRVSLASLPLVDIEENAAIVNALQRHATVVVQKSLEEGFGLTVTEAMWKGRPVLASAVGGIRDQIEDGVHGVLLEDPTDREAVARALQGLLADPDRRARLGSNARARVRDHFLVTGSLSSYGALVERIDV